jgi:endonuclease/exonuclease/phosphatase family metal-dependent hydrolase
VTWETHPSRAGEIARSGRLAVMAVLVALMLGSSAIATRAADDEITVMTRNLYQGADLGPVIAAPTQNAFLLAVAAVLNQARATDLRGRMEAIAAEIDEARPDLVGLQEAVLWRTQSPADFSPTPNATNVDADLLKLLLDALAARGLKYDVVAAQDGFDVEAPGLFATGLMDVRLTQREVILARKSTPMKLTNVQHGKYAARITIPTVGGPVTLPWAWASVDVRFHGHAFRFATTHLDSISGGAQGAQANEFLAGPGDTPLPIVWVGDFNSDADGTPITGVPPATATYGSIIAAGFEDTWAAKHPSDPGLTCCQDADLLNPTSTLTERIDLVLTRGDISVEEAARVGADPADRLPSGLWPSDHAGVVVSLELEDD